MEESLRRRKVEGLGSKEGDKEADTDLGVRSSGARVDRTFTFLISLLFLVLGVLVLAHLFPALPLSPLLTSLTHSLLHLSGLTIAQHAVIIDAGSTGSRVLAFTFSRSPLTNKLVLMDELWREVKPGLSSFADDPAAGAATIADLLSSAKGVIPAHMWEETPVSLAATAGLRLLPSASAEALLAAAAQELETSGLNSRGVSIMEDIKEGLLGWATVNYLLGAEGDSSYVALDLGGGSTQVTFRPTSQDTLSNSPEDFLTEYGGSKIYSHSYLGLGLMAGRKALLEQGDPQGSEELASACVSINRKEGELKYKGSFRLKEEQGSCAVEAKEFIQSAEVHPAQELKSKNLVAFSYFFDRAVDAGLVRKGEWEGVASVGEFSSAASSACSSQLSPSFLCLDLSFIASLLQHGYRLPQDAQIKLVKKINGHETSWALGAALELLAA